MNLVTINQPAIRRRLTHHCVTRSFHIDTQQTTMRRPNQVSQRSFTTNVYNKTRRRPATIYKNETARAKRRLNIFWESFEFASILIVQCRRWLRNGSKGKLVIDNFEINYILCCGRNGTHGTWRLKGFLLLLGFCEGKRFAGNIFFASFPETHLYLQFITSEWLDKLGGNNTLLLIIYA